MTLKAMLMKSRLQIFRWEMMFYPISISVRYISTDGKRVYEWKDLRVFGFRIATWGAFG